MHKNYSALFFMAALLFNSLFTNAQDWANLNRYQAENTSILAPIEGESRVVFMGNSITQGWKVKSPEFFSSNPYLCRGISGQTTPQMLVRFKQDVVALQPDVVVILAGTNDIAGNTGPSTLEMIMDNLSSMAEIAVANKIKVILCSVLPVYDYPWRKGIEPNILIPKLNEMIKSYSTKNKIVYLDFFSAMNDGNNGLRPELTTDGVHCTLEGYKMMESMLKPALEKVLEEKR